MTEKENEASTISGVEHMCVAPHKRPHPPICMRCGNRLDVDCFGDLTYCGLMVEAMREGVPVFSCAHFRALCDGKGKRCGDGN